MDWKNVKNELPAESKMVLCFLENCGIKMMHYMGNSIFAEPWQGGILKVKCWMELPEPPK